MPKLVSAIIMSQFTASKEVFELFWVYLTLKSILSLNQE